MAAICSPLPFVELTASESVPAPSLRTVPTTYSAAVAACPTERFKLTAVPAAWLVIRPPGDAEMMFRLLL